VDLRDTKAGSAAADAYLYEAKDCLGKPQPLVVKAPRRLTTARAG
jgi:hypothetical protein